MKPRLVVLDRDGVINQDSDAYIKSAVEWQPIEGSIAAIAALHQAGYSVYIATNQSGLARQLFGLADLDAMHAKMNALVEGAGGVIAGIFYCDHLPVANCDCRKPKTGLLEQIEHHSGLSVEGFAFIGDSMKDLQAGHAKDMQALLVRTGKGQATEVALEESRPSDLHNVEVAVFDNLSAASTFLINLQE